MGDEFTLNPEEVLQQLKAGAKSKRTIDSLEIIHLICKEQFNRKSYNFSYSMIGTLSGERGGPTAQPIRNATGAAYRTLIDTWARFSNSGARIMTSQRPSNLQNDVLSLINDSVARILVQKYMSENTKLRNENQLLKVAAKDRVVIDLSGTQGGCSCTFDAFASKNLLLEQEIFALKSAISAETMRRNGWASDANSGAVKKGPLTIFSPGFITGIAKILNEISEN